MNFMPIWIQRLAVEENKLINTAISEFFCGLPQQLQFSRLLQACLASRLDRRERACEITKPGAQKLHLISEMFEMLSFNCFWNEYSRLPGLQDHLLICNAKFYKSLMEFELCFSVLFFYFRESFFQTRRDWPWQWKRRLKYLIYVRYHISEQCKTEEHPGTCCSLITSVENGLQHCPFTDTDTTLPM